MKKFLSLFLLLCLLMTLMPLALFSVSAAPGGYSGGSGSEADPYRIATTEDFKALAAAVNSGNTYAGKYFVQTANLDFGGERLTPIGYSDSTGYVSDTECTPFSGSYDGQGFQIRNAVIYTSASHAETNVDGVAYADNDGTAWVTHVSGKANRPHGLFGTVVQGRIVNVNAVNVTAGYLREDRYLGNGYLNEYFNVPYSITGGVIAGLVSESVIDNCTADSGSVSVGALCAGGIVGYAKGSRILSCRSAAAVVSGLNAGGIVGCGHDLTFMRCINNGSVRVLHSYDNVPRIAVGGILGKNDRPEKLTFSACINGEHASLVADSKAKVSDSDNGRSVRLCVGGILGFVGKDEAGYFDMTFDSCYNLMMEDVVLHRALGSISNKIFTPTETDEESAYKVGALIGQVGDGDEAAWRAVTKVNGCYSVPVYKVYARYVSGTRGSDDWKVTQTPAVLNVGSNGTTDGFLHSNATGYATYENSVYGVSPSFIRALPLYGAIMGEGMTDTADPSEVRYVGLQSSSVSEGSYSIRLLAVLDALTYKEVGFMMTRKVGGETKTATFRTSTVYGSIRGNTDTGLKTYTAQELGGKYIMALTLTGLRETQAEELTVTPYSLYEGETVSYVGYAISLGSDGSVTTKRLDSSDEEKPPVLQPVIVNGRTDYTIVYPAGDTEARKSAEALQAEILRVYGVSMAVTADSVSATAHEILIDKTNRAETAEASKLAGREKDCICTLVDEKIILMGGTQKGTDKAIRRFSAEYLCSVSDTRTLTYSTATDYCFCTGYEMDLSRIAGNALTDYQIVYPKGSTKGEYYAALNLRYELYYKAELDVPVVSDAAEPSAREIRIGSLANRSAAPAVGEDEYVLTVENGTLWITASDFFGYLAADGYMTETLAVEKSELEEGFFYLGFVEDAPRQNGDYRVMFQNIWGLSPNDTATSGGVTYKPYVANRDEYAAALYLAYSPDVIGLNEYWRRSNVSGEMSDEGVLRRLLMENGYDSAYGGVLGATSGESTIFYKKETLKVVYEKYEFFPYINFNTGNVGQSGLGADIVVFEARATGEKFCVVSAHYESNGQNGESYYIKGVQQRKNQVDSIMTRLQNEVFATFGQIPVVLGGDYNSTTTGQTHSGINYEDACEYMIDTYGWKDSQVEAAVTDPDSSTHGYPIYDETLGYYVKGGYSGQGSYASSIDHIFQYGSLDARQFYTVTDDYSTILSDHSPVVLDFNLK